MKFPDQEVTERQKLREMLQRVHALCNRLVADICQRIQDHTGLQQLDELMTLAERGNAISRRIYARYVTARQAE